MTSITPPSSAPDEPDQPGFDSVGRSIADEVVICGRFKMLSDKIPSRDLRIYLEELAIDAQNKVTKHLSESPRFPQDVWVSRSRAYQDFVSRVRHLKRRVRNR